MKKTYITPEIEEIVISVQLLGGSQKMNFFEKPDPNDDEDDEVDDFDQLL